MRAVVTGASGFIGSALSDELRSRGWTVAAVTRRPIAVSADRVIAICDDLAAVRWEPIVDGADVVFHLAAHVHVSRASRSFRQGVFDRVNVLATSLLARSAAAAGVGQFVFLSSAGVHGEISDRPLREDDAIRPANFYTASKAKAEQELLRLKDRLRVTILRPPLVYGLAAPSNFHALLRAVALRLPLPLDNIANTRSMLFINNLVDAMLRSVERGIESGEAFLIHDIDLSTRELVRVLAEGMATIPRLVALPRSWIKLLERRPIVGRKLRSLTGSFQIDSSKFRTMTGWMPPYDPAEALRRIGEDFMARQRR